MYITKEEAQEIRHELDHIVKAEGSALAKLWMWFESNREGTGFYLFREDTVLRSRVLRDEAEGQG